MAEFGFVTMMNSMRLNQQTCWSWSQRMKQHIKYVDDAGILTHQGWEEPVKVCTDGRCVMKTTEEWTDDELHMER